MLCVVVEFDIVVHYHILIINHLGVRKTYFIIAASCQRKNSASIKHTMYAKECSIIPIDSSHNAMQDTGSKFSFSG